MELIAQIPHVVIKRDRTITEGWQLRLQKSNTSNLVCSSFRCLLANEVITITTLTADMTWFSATEATSSGVGDLTTPDVDHLGYTASPRNDNCSTSGERAAVELVLVALTVPLTILTTVGNFLLIFTILSTEPLRTVTNAYVVSIAFRYGPSIRKFY